MTLVLLMEQMHVYYCRTFSKAVRGEIRSLQADMDLDRH